VARKSGLGWGASKQCHEPGGYKEPKICPEISGQNRVEWLSGGLRPPDIHQIKSQTTPQIRHSNLARWHTNKRFPRQVSAKNRPNSALLTKTCLLRGPVTITDSEFGRHEIAL